jgi:Bacterial aa3 type cytochrome c oxidase subunit IV
MKIDPKECSPAMDYTEHAKTYGLFCKLTAYTIVGVIAVMAVLALFVA